MAIGTPAEAIGGKILDEDTILVDSGVVAPVIFAKEHTPFIRFCLLAESLDATYGKIVETYRSKTKGGWMTDLDVVSDSEDEEGGGANGSDTDSETDVTVGPPQSLGSAPYAKRRAPDVETGTALGAQYDRERGLGSDGRFRGPSDDNTTVRGDAKLESLRQRGAPSLDMVPTEGEATRVEVLSEDPRPAYHEDNFSAPPPLVRVTHANSNFVSSTPQYDGDDTGSEWRTVNKVELWNAFDVFMTVKQVDTTLIRAIVDGTVNLAVSPQEHQNADQIVRERVDTWYKAYGTRTYSYNTCLDAFLARVGNYLTAETKQDRTGEAKELRGLLYGIYYYRRQLIPNVEPAHQSAGREDTR